MALRSVTLDEGEWASVMAILGQTKEFPWVVTNPLLMKLGQQLQASDPVEPLARPNGPDHEAAGGNIVRGGAGSRRSQA